MTNNLCVAVRAKLGLTPQMDVSPYAYELKLPVYAFEIVSDSDGKWF